MYILNKLGRQKLKKILDERGLRDQLDLDHRAMELADNYDPRTGESCIALGKVEGNRYRFSADTVEAFDFHAEDFDLIEGFRS